MSSGAHPVTHSAWAGPARIGPLRLTAANATVLFAVRFLRFFTIRGLFSDVEGEVVFDEAHPGETSLVARVAVQSVQTGNRLRDAHLRSSRWFNVKTHPHIEMRAHLAERAGAGVRVVGIVTIKGRQAPVEMPCTTRSEDGVSVEMVGRFVIPRASYGVGPPPYGVAPWDPRAYFVDDGVSVELRLRLDQ
ncbi:MAG TPA: YceI family protein [Gemmatimonadaceae bacterium]|nr:YceI family protein [Gemmatimonadaceae bacterium]